MDVIPNTGQVGTAKSRPEEGNKTTGLPENVQLIHNCVMG